MNTEGKNRQLDWLTTIFNRAACGMCTLIMLGLASSGVNAASLTHIVGPQDNLYFDNWGHPWTGGSPESEFGALSTGIAARSVGDAGGPFNFEGIPSVDVSATGTIRDSGGRFTNASGSASPFRGLRVYSMIGTWSSTPNSITPIDSPFFVGISNTLAVPTEPSAYLFLGENDGIFSDNFVGQYNVSLNFVPIPSAVWLFGSGLFGLIGISRRKKESVSS
jgi:hypothetical protein